jgi:lysozyme
MKYTDKAVELIKKYRGFSAIPYENYFGEINIGYGHLWNKGDADEISKETAEKLLKIDLTIISSNLDDLGLKLSQNQFDALCSFVFATNIGTFKSSILYKLIKSNKYSPLVKINWIGWCIISGERSKRLRDWRKEEVNLFYK